jgi:hypothetical protein
LILGQSVWHAFFESAVDTDEKFIQAMDALAREIGDRGKIKAKVAEGVPPPKAVTPAPAAAADFEPTPEPAPAPILTPARAPAPEVAAAVPSTPPHASLAVAEQQGFSPSMQHIQMSPPMPTMPMHSSAELTALVERLLAQQKDLMKEQRDEAKADMAAKDAKMEQQRAEAKAEQTELIDAMERQHAAELARVQKPPAAAISEEQLSHLQARLEGLHMTKLLSDDELFALEDLVADWVSL